MPEGFERTGEVGVGMENGLKDLLPDAAERERQTILQILTPHPALSPLRGEGEKLWFHCARVWIAAGSRCHMPIAELLEKWWQCKRGISGGFTFECTSEKIEKPATGGGDGRAGAGGVKHFLFGEVAVLSGQEHVHEQRADGDALRIDAGIFDALDQIRIEKSRRMPQPRVAEVFGFGVEVGRHGS